MRFELKWSARFLMICLFCGAAGSYAVSQTFATLANFNTTVGYSPVSPLTVGPDGNLYGMASNGGTQNQGTFFRITPSGNLTVLLNCNPNIGDCADPTAPLFLASDGNFYGSSVAGGNAFEGNVFKITTSGQLTTIYSFCSQPNCSDGFSPEVGVVQGNDGNFYGTTNEANGLGRVYKVTPTGVLTTLYHFCSLANCADGATPASSLVQGRDGNFYGTTSGGGANGMGTVYRITPTGTLTTLYSFCAQPGCTDGISPFGAVAQGSNGNFYGATSAGGPNPNNCTGGGCGTIFEITSSGNLTTLHAFNGIDGDHPLGQLFLAIDGTFYGTTSQGGSSSTNCFPIPCGGGTVFKITPTGTLTNEHVFCPDPNTCGNVGITSIGGLAQTANGTFYGTTQQGGTSFDGTAFSLMVVASTPNFSITASPLIPTSIHDGASATSTVTLTALNGYNATINLTCNVSGGGSPLPTCSLSPSSVTPTTNGLQTMLTVTAIAPSMAAVRDRNIFAAIWLLVIGMTLSCAPASAGQRKLFSVVLFALSMTFLLSCGGGNSDPKGSGGTPPGSYTVTVTGTDASNLSNSTQVMLTVN